MKIAKSILSVLSLGLLLTACNSVDFKKTKSGVPYKIFPSKSGDKIAEGNIVKFHIIQKLKDSVLGSTYTSMPQYNQVTKGTGGYDFQNAIMDILLQSKKGDSIYFTIAIDSFIAKDPTILQKTPFKRGDQIATTIRVLEVFKSPQEAQADFEKVRVGASAAMEKEQLKSFQTDTMVKRQMGVDNKVIEDYLAANNIQAQKTEWGAYVQVINPGQGAKPTNGQFVNVKYKGALLNGQVFDQGTYPLQVGVGGSIKGFEEGVKQLGKGGSGKVFVPSLLGYGPQGSAPKIGPNAILMFDLEVLDITNEAPAQPQPQNIDTTQR